MFTPISTITVSGWMLQTVNKSTQKQRAQALTAKGNEHAHAYYGERTTETAEFTLGGNYTGNITVPSLGAGIIEWMLTYTETAFPALSTGRDVVPTIMISLLFSIKVSCAFSLSGRDMSIAPIRATYSPSLTLMA